MIEMSNREYSEFTRDLFAKFNAGEMTAFPLSDAAWQ